MKFFNKMIEMLRSGEPFKFSRWGDGEWGCMHGWQGKNRDGNEYLPELRAELIKIIESEPDYYIGIQPGVLVDVGRGYDPGMRKYVLDTLFRLNLNTVVGDILHYASEFGHLKKFTDALKDRDVVMVGPEYFFTKETSALFNHGFKIIGTNSFTGNDSILGTIEINMENCGKNPVFLVAAAMNSNVIIDRLPDNVTAIDIGSVFDPYLGRPRATYQHNMNVTLKDLW